MTDTLPPLEALASTKILSLEDDEEDYHRRLCVWCDECRLRQAEGKTRRPPRPTRAPSLRQHLVARYRDEGVVDRFLVAMTTNRTSSGGSIEQVDVPRVVRQLKYYDHLMNEENVERVAVALAFLARRI